MRGGQREGAGRPKGQPTTTIAIRVRIEYAPAVRQAIAQKIAELEAEEKAKKYLLNIIE
jgi:hypothetical protein